MVEVGGSIGNYFFIASFYQTCMMHLNIESILFSCFESNLNGIYYKTPVNNQFFKGIIWEHWLGNYSLKKTLMMIRKDTFSASYENDEHGYIPNFEDP